jgi:hypothetical protein
MKNEQSRDTGNTGVKTKSEIKLIRNKQHDDNILYLSKLTLYH